MVVGVTTLATLGRKKRKKEKQKQKKVAEEEAKKAAEANITSAPEPKTDQPEVFRDPKTGRLSGVSIGGKTFLGLSPQDVRKITEQERLKQVTPEGAVEVSQAATERKAELLGEQIGQLTPEQEAQISEAERSDIINRQAILSATGQALPSTVSTAAQFAAGGAVVGAVGGPVGVGAGAAIGATVGAVTSFYSGFRGNLRAQASGEVSASSVVLRDNRRLMQRVVSNMWTSRGDLDDSIDTFNQAKANILEESAKLKLETDSDLNKFLSEDGTKTLQQYENFLAPNGMLEFWEGEFRTALVSPVNPERGIALLNEVDIQEFS